MDSVGNEEIISAIDEINHLSPLGSKVLKRVEILVWKNRMDDKALINALNQYAINLKVMQR